MITDQGDIIVLSFWSSELYYIWIVALEHIIFPYNGFYDQPKK